MSESQLNMTAEQNNNDPTAQQHATDTTTPPLTQPPSSFSDGARVLAPENVLAMSSGTSDEGSTRAEIKSPFVTPPQQQPPQRKRRGELPASRNGTPRPSREPSPAGSTAESGHGSEPPPLKRPLHRRIEPAADSYPGRLARLEEQHEADREMITWLGDQVKYLYDKASMHDSALDKMRRAAESASRNLLGIESAVLKRIDEGKAFIDKKLTHEMDLKL